MQEDHRTGRTHLRLTPLSIALRSTLLCIALGVVLPVTNTHAQNTAASSATYSFNIASGSLEVALDHFARSTGANLSYDQRLIQGLNTHGLQGTYSIATGLATLLSGSTLEAVALPSGGFVLQPGDEKTLPVINVQIAPSATTEGTGSYTSKLTSSATGLNLSLRDTPQSVSIITRQKMDDQASNSLAEVLRATTGVAESAYDTERSSFSYRGFSVDNYQYDGVPTGFESPYSAGESDIDSAIYDRVEIVRGATGLMTGAGNPSAAINLVRKRASSKTLTGQLTASVGSWDNYRATADISTPLNQDGSVRARFVGAGQTSHSFIERNKKKKGIAYGTIEADLTTKTTLRIGADYQVNRPTASTWGGALPTGWFKNGEEIDWPTSYSGAPNWSSWASTQQSQFAILEHTLQNGWTSQIGYTHSKQAYDAKLGMSIGGQIDPQTWTTSSSTVYANWYEGYREQHAINAKLDGQFDLFGREHSFVAGASTSLQRSYGTVRFVDSSASYTGSLLDWDGSYPEPVWTAQEPELDSNTRQSAAYGALRLSIADPLKLIIGARYSVWDRSDYNTFRVVTPYAGIIYDLNKYFSVYTSYTDIFQPQNVQDINGNYLDPVEGRNYEAGIKGTFFDNRVNASLSVFKIIQNNVAEEDNSAPVPGTMTQAYYGAEGATSKGYEFEINGAITPNWNASFGYSHFNMKDRFDAELSTTTPRSTMNLFTTYKFSGALEKLTLGGGARWQSEVKTTVWGQDGSGSSVQRPLRQGGYSVIDLMARYSFTPETTLQLNIANAINRKYYSQINFYNTRAYGAPRNFTVTLRQTF